MFGSSNTNSNVFMNFAALAPWCTERFLYPVVVVECSRDADAAALKNGMELIQLLRPFSTCQGPIVSRTEEKRKQVVTTHPFGVRLTKSSCVRPLGNYFANVLEEHVRHLMMGKDDEHATSTGSEDASRIICKDLLWSSYSSSGDAHDAAAKKPFHFSSWPWDHQHSKGKSVKEETAAFVGGPKPRPQYVRAGDVTKENDKGASGDENSQRTTSDLNILLSHTIPPWYSPFLKDVHHLVRCSHVETFDYPVGIIYAVSTREGLHDHASITSSSWKKIVVNAIRNELLRQYEVVQQRVYSGAPMIDRVVHSYFILVHDDDRLGASTAVGHSSQENLFPMSSSDVAELLRECQGLTSSLPMMKDLVGLGDARRRECWTLLTLNSAENPLHRNAKHRSGEALDAMRWVRANPLSADVLSEVCFDEVFAFSFQNTPSHSPGEEQSTPRDPPAPLLSRTTGPEVIPLGSRVTVSTDDVFTRKTYYLPFQWERHVVKEVSGTWCVEYDSKEGEKRKEKLFKYTGCYLSQENVTDLEAMMTSYLAHHLARFIEQRVFQLSTEISQRRTTTFGKMAAWFKSEESKPKPEVVFLSSQGNSSSIRGGGSGIQRFKYTSIEMQMRRCADYCMFLQDFEMAQTNYKLCRGELLESVQNRLLVQPLLGGVQEALTLCELYLKQNAQILPAVPQPYSSSLGSTGAYSGKSYSGFLYGPDSIANPKCHGVSRLEVALSDFFHSCSPVDGGEETLKTSILRLTLFLFEVCRNHSNPRPAMDRAAKVLLNFLQSGIPEQTSHIWVAITHQLLAGAYLFMNPPYAPNALSGRDTALTEKGDKRFASDFPVLSYLRRYVYHLHQSGSHWFVECTQRPSSAQAALHCYRQLFMCCKDLLRQESLLLLKNRTQDNTTGHTVQQQRSGWRAMLDDIVGKLLFLLLPQHQNMQRERQRLHLLSSPNQNGSEVIQSEGGSSFEYASEKQKLEDEALAIVIYAIARNIRCHFGQNSNSTAEQDVRLLFELQQRCRVVPPYLSFTSADHSSAPPPVQESKTSSKDKKGDDVETGALPSGYMVLPLVDPNSLVFHLDYYKLDEESQKAGKSACVSVGNLLNKEWHLTEEKLRKYFEKQSAAGNDGTRGEQDTSPCHDGKKINVIPSFFFPPYVGDASSLRVGFSDARKQMTLMMKENNASSTATLQDFNTNPHYPESPVLFTNGEGGAYFHSRTASPSFGSLNGVSRTEGNSPRLDGECYFNTLRSHFPNAVLPHLLFTVPQHQRVWLSVCFLNPLDVSLFVTDLCLVYIIEEEDEVTERGDTLCQSATSFGVTVDDHVLQSSHQSPLDDKSTPFRSFDATKAWSTDLDGSECKNHTVREYERFRRGVPVPYGTRVEHKTSLCDGNDSKVVELKPFQSREERIPFDTAKLPCGPIQVIGLSWKLSLGRGASNGKAHSLYEGRYYFATAMSGGSPPPLPHDLRTEQTENWDEMRGEHQSKQRNESEMAIPTLQTKASSRTHDIPLRVGASLPLHSFVSHPSVLNAPENIRLGVTPSRASLVSRFEPPLPAQLFDGEVFRTKLILTNTATVGSCLSCGASFTGGYSCGSNPSVASPLSVSAADDEAPKLLAAGVGFHPSPPHIYANKVVGGYARHVTVQLSPHNACLVEVEGFSSPSSDGPENTKCTFMIAECIEPGESLELPITVRARYHSVSLQASMSSEHSFNDVMFLIGYIPSCFQSGEPTAEHHSASQGDFRSLSSKHQRVNSIKQEKKKGAFLRSSKIFPLPLNSVALHRIHRRLRVDPLLSIYATVLPPWTSLLESSDCSCSRGGLHPIVSLSVKNLIRTSRSIVASSASREEDTALRIVAITATHDARWRVRQYKLPNQKEDHPDANAPSSCATVTPGGAYSTLLTLERRPFCYAEATNLSPCDPSINSELEMARNDCSTPVMVEENWNLCSAETPLFEENCESGKLYAKVFESRVTTSNAKDSLGEEGVVSDEAYFGCELSIRSPLSRFFFLRTSIVGVGRMGGDAPNQGTFTVYMDGKSKKMQAPKGRTGISDRARGDLPFGLPFQQSKLNIQEDGPLTEAEEREREMEAERATYGRVLEQFSPIALTVHWAITSRRDGEVVGADDTVKDTRERVQRRGCMYHWVDPLGFFASPPVTGVPETANDAQNDIHEEENWQVAIARRVQQQLLCSTMVAKVPYNQLTHQQYYRYKGALVYHVYSKVKSPYIFHWKTPRAHAADSEGEYRGGTVRAELMGEVPVSVRMRSFAPLPLLVSLLPHPSMHSGFQRLPSSGNIVSFTSSNPQSPLWSVSDISAGSLDLGGDDVAYRLHAVLEDDSLAEDSTAAPPSNMLQCCEQGVPITAAVLLPGESIDISLKVILYLRKASIDSKSTRWAKNRSEPPLKLSCDSDSLHLILDCNLFSYKIQPLYFLPESANIVSGMSLNAFLCALKRTIDSERMDEESFRSSFPSICSTVEARGDVAGRQPVRRNSTFLASSSSTFGGNANFTVTLISMLAREPEAAKLLLAKAAPPTFPPSHIGVIGLPALVTISVDDAEHVEEEERDNGLPSPLRSITESERLWSNAALLLADRCDIHFKSNAATAPTHQLEALSYAVAAHNSSDEGNGLRYERTNGQGQPNVKDAGVAGGGMHRGKLPREWVKELHSIADCLDRDFVK